MMMMMLDDDDDDGDDNDDDGDGDCFSTVAGPPWRAADASSSDVLA